MAFFLCSSLLLSLSVSGIAQEQGDLVSQQSCTSELETVSLLQRDVRIETKVTQQQTTQEDVKEEDDDELQEEMDDNGKQDDKDDQVDDDPEEQIGSVSEKNRGGEPRSTDLKQGQWTNHRRRGARPYTTRSIGFQICRICNQKSIVKLGLDFGKCWSKDIWPSKLVNVIAGRRRAEQKTCFAVSALKDPVTRSFRNRHKIKTYKSRLGIGYGGKAPKEEARDTTITMCRCLQRLLDKCKNAECMQQKLCDCPSLCSNFKKDLGCRDSFLEIHHSSERSNHSGALDAHKGKDSSTAVAGLDGSLSGKCGSNEV